MYIAFLNIQKLITNHPDVIHTKHDGWNEVMEQTRSMMYNKVLHNEMTIEMHSKEPIKGKIINGRPKQNRLKPMVEKLQYAPKSNEKRKRSCKLCGELGHIVVTFQKKSGYGSTVTNIDEVCIELCNVASTYMPIHVLPDGLLSSDIKTGVPKETVYISIGPKYIQYKSILSQTESNLCVLVVCIGEAGIELEGFNPCYMSVTSVREWIVKSHNNKQHVLTLNKHFPVVQLSPSKVGTKKSAVQLSCSKCKTPSPKKQQLNKRSCEKRR